uniref:Mitochondrial carrier protein n=1 Tax=Romanomermis culicivorax TaxID=13658 RepID=A0A915HVZ7_ROMCU
MRCDKKRPYRDFVCGWGAAFIEMSLTFPLNKLIFRQQLFNISAGQAAGQIRSEGIRFLYRGLLPPLCQKAASRSIMFGMFDRFSTMAGCKNGTEKYFTPCHAFCALLAGTSEAVLVPFERVQTLMQCQRYHNHFKNTFHAFVEVKKFGYREFYR